MSTYTLHRMSLGIWVWLESGLSVQYRSESFESTGNMIGPVTIMEY